MRSLKYIAVALLIAACGTGGNDSASESTTTTTDQATTTTEVPTTMSLSKGLPEALAERIITDAADRTGVPISEIEVVSVEEVTFNDSSLDCPEPGMAYTQVLTPGQIVLVDAGGEELDYRVASGSNIFRLCE
jgi:hypothetical protein